LSEGIVLFAHGSRDRDWARPFETLAAMLTAKVTGPVALAYLESMQPALAEAIATLVQRGATAIRVVPVFLGPAATSRTTCRASLRARAPTIPRSRSGWTRRSANSRR